MPTPIPKPKTDPELESMKNEIQSMQKEMSLLKLIVKDNQSKELKFEIGEFDIDDEIKWGQIKDAVVGKIEKFKKYTIPIKLCKFSKTPQVFLSITAFEAVDGIWIYADKITSKGFEIILESKYDLDETILGKYGRLVMSWLAFGS